MDGLIVNQPHAGLIIEGKKQWELRNRHAPKSKIGSEIYLLSKGNILGKIKIKYSKGPVDLEELKITAHLHKTNLDKLGGSFSLYVWEVDISEKFERPKKYLHPNGAQVWIKNVLLFEHYMQGKITTYF